MTEERYVKVFGQSDSKKLAVFRGSKIPKNTLSRIARKLLRPYIKDGATLNGKHGKKNSSIEQEYGVNALQSVIGNLYTNNICQIYINNIYKIYI